ncbi:nephrin [Trichonephila inaurata madagascariensis]|uniref:Nephrin n=1 Tax=Trichonephila inaurata madagascariensis TaxID=2747483 RepID=A0A8X6YPV9_9ARAC|nr:nephrin [Trichonephila inaurata madagascariensis]
MPWDPDSKVFTCYAENPPVRKKTYRTHKLTVTYPPQPPTILGYEEGTPLRVGQLQTFNCVALGGNPPANLKWYRGDREDPTLFIIDKVRIPPANVTITVNPCDPKAGDEGQGQKRDLPAVTNNVTIRVRHKPEFPDPYQRVDVIEGMNATINVSVNAYPNVAWFSWTKDSTLIPPVSEIDDHNHRVMSSGAVLYILNIARKDGGTYVCMAENEEGTSNATIILNVRVWEY